MIKKRLFIVVIIAIFFLLSINLNSFANRFAINILNNIRSEYLYFIESVKEKINEHFNQKEEIKKLRQEVKALSYQNELLPLYVSKLNNLLAENNLSVFDPKLQLVEALSYVKLNDYSKVWLKFPSFDKDKVYGLLYKGYSAGIVTQKDSMPLGLLQSSQECTFSIYIGKNKIPGVIFGNKEIMIIKYIPPWMEPKFGDIVITSGLDNIFFEGIKVGKVIKVYDEKMYKSAVVKPYVNIRIPGFFHAILH